MARGFQMGGAPILGGDAAASDILLNKTAFVDGEEITGIMPELLNFIDYISEKSDTIYIPEGHHAGSGKISISSAEQAKIIASNIRKDVTILGETGTLQEGIDTSDATATASDILSGKTAYVNGSKVTGNITSQTAKTVTPTTSAQTAVNSGKYCSGNITVGAIPNQTTGGTKYATTSAQTILSAPKWLTSALTIGALSQTNLAAANIVRGKTITIKNGSANVWSVAGSSNALKYKSGSGNSSAQDGSRKYFYYNNSGDREYLCWLNVNPGMTPVMMLSICGEAFHFRSGNTWYTTNPYGTSTSTHSSNNGIWTFSSSSVLCPGQDWQATIYYWIFGY